MEPNENGATKIDVSTLPQEQQEILDLISGFAPEIPEEREEKKDEEGEKKNDSQKTDEGGFAEERKEPESSVGEPVKDSQKTDVTKSAAEVKEEPTAGAEDKPDKVAELTATIESLRSVIQELTSGVRPTPVKKEPERSSGDPAEKVETPTKKADLEFPSLAKGEDVEYLPKEKADLAMDKPHEIFNSAMNAVRRSAVELVFAQLPNFITSLVDEQLRMNRVIDDFYGQNKDLMPFKDFVAVQAQAIEAKNPSWGMKEILEETAKVSRDKLRLVERAQEMAPAPPSKKSAQASGLIGTKSSRTEQKPTPAQKSELQKEIDELI
jgi:hypothetical protein